MAIFLPVQNRGNALFTVGTVAELKGPIFANQALNFTMLLKVMERICCSMDGQKVAMDSIGGAAGFMALALVGVYVAIILSH